MSHVMIRLVLSALLLAMMTGCASLPPTPPEHELADRESALRSNKKIWTIAAILVVGAILVHEVEDGVQDSLRQVSPP